MIRIVVLSCFHEIRCAYRVRSASSEQDHSDMEHTEKSPLVSTKLETFAKLLFNRSIAQDSCGGSSSKDGTSPLRCAKFTVMPSFKFLSILDDWYHLCCNIIRGTCFLLIVIRIIHLVMYS